jgi:dienelactone hydrolase
MINVQKRFLGCLAFSVVIVAGIGCQPAGGRGVIHPAGTLPKTTPWDLRALSQPPAYHWLKQEGKVWSLLYQGLPYQGHPTEVFAYYADPLTLSKTTKKNVKFPAVVLVHGGGGEAFSKWAKMWAEHGYAAIAMNLQGNGKDKKRLDNGGPALAHENIFPTVDEPYENQWPYHAVADVILAHSLIRSFENVDAAHTAITGISWGGYLTCIVAGLDNRFTAAVPVYGCGFLDPDSAWQGEFEKLTAARREKWTRLWDPSRYVGSATMPMFFVNGTNDFAYWLESYERTYKLVKTHKNYRILPGMMHSHEHGWEPKEIGLFIDQYCHDGVLLPEISSPKIIDGRIDASVRTQTKLVAAHLYYTEDDLPNTQRRFFSQSLDIIADHLVGDPPPTPARIWFVTADDDRGSVVSSPLVFAKP